MLKKKNAQRVAQCRALGQAVGFDENPTMTSREGCSIGAATAGARWQRLQANSFQHSLGMKAGRGGKDWGGSNLCALQSPSSQPKSFLRRQTATTVLPF